MADADRSRTEQAREPVITAEELRKIAEITTVDSERSTALFASREIDALTIEKAKADDPRELRTARRHAVPSSYDKDIATGERKIPDRVLAEILRWCLVADTYTTTNVQAQAVVRRIADLFDRAIAGDEPTKTEWDGAARAAWDTWAAWAACAHDLPCLPRAHIDADRGPTHAEIHLVLLECGVRIYSRGERER